MLHIFVFSSVFIISIDEMLFFCSICSTNFIKTIFSFLFICLFVDCLISGCISEDIIGCLCQEMFENWTVRFLLFRYLEELFLFLIPVEDDEYPEILFYNGIFTFQYELVWDYDTCPYFDIK